MPGTRTPTKKSWRGMKYRCNHPDEYPRHGGKGITYNPEWESFENFLKDMGERPHGTSLDRYPDKGGNYCKENCRWATPRQQACNKSTNVIVPGVRSDGSNWRTTIRIKGKVTTLYRGKDFFEAVCAIKSFEVKL